MSTDSGETISPKISDYVDTTFARRAEEFEQARQARQAALDAARQRRAKRVERQFWFLFWFLVIAIAILAYRVETNDDHLQEAALNGCEKRVEQAVQANNDRATFYTFVINQPTSANLTPAEKDQILQQLKTGMNLPIEDCSIYQPAS